MAAAEVFPVRLKEARHKRGWSQLKLSVESGVCRGAISHYERAYRQPDLDQLARLADVLNVSTDYLLGRSEVPQCRTSL
ncbi:helix-turn-helix domain-containing protein [Paenibacillus thailandensis]|uniref:Helix-turn-helix domain-containing protein n=1 Tax=Paenibacillus thailandensis TaxID=393250 RepID=A0ABW5R2Y5_9BACL